MCASAWKTVCGSVRVNLPAATPSRFAVCAASSRGSGSRRPRLTRRATSCISKGPTRSRSDVQFAALPREARRLIALAPAVKCFEHRAERLSLVGQKIFVARWVVLVEAGGDHALALEPLQPRRQRVRRHTREPGFELLKA